MERELVKIASDNPAFNGYYTQFRDMMKPGDIIFGETPETKPAMVETPKPINRKKVKNNDTLSE